MSMYGMALHIIRWRADAREAKIHIYWVHLWGKRSEGRVSMYYHIVRIDISYQRHHSHTLFIIVIHE